MENWKDILGTDYSVSDQGRVASRKRGGWRVRKDGLNSGGYMQVCLGGGGRQRTVKVHKLVAEAFLGPKPTPRHEVNHKDGDKANNRAENLEWVTKSENSRHRFDVLRHGNLRGEAHNLAKLTEVDVREILRRRAAGETLVSIGCDYGVNHTTVSRIARRKIWGWVS